MKYDKTIVEALVSGAGEDEVRTWLDRGVGDPGSWNPTLAGSAIEAAVRLQKVELLQSLERAPKPLKKAARRGLHKLKSQGVTVDAAAPKAKLSSWQVEHLMQLLDTNGNGKITLDEW